MSNWYNVLEVSTAASQSVIDAAYERISSELRFREQTPEVVERHEQLLRAHTILGDPELRLAYDAKLAAAAPPVPTTPDVAADEGIAMVTPAIAAANVEEGPGSDSESGTGFERPGTVVTETPPPVPARGGPPRGLLVGALVCLVVALVAIGVGGAIFFLRDDDSSAAATDAANALVAYPVDLADDKYLLAEMALRQEDLPEGIIKAQAGDFNNDQWAEVINAEDPEPELARLESVGRLTNHLAFFSYEDPVQHLGRPYQFVSQSTLFKDETSAVESIRGLCDLPLSVSDPRPHPDFEVPTIGQESAGFSLSSIEDPLGEQIDTTVCFRTGRIVHSVTQRGLDGTVNQELSVQLAQRMLQYVNAAFTGTDPAPAPTATAVPTKPKAK